MEIYRFKPTIEAALARGESIVEIPVTNEAEEEKCLKTLVSNGLLTKYNYVCKDLDDYWCCVLRKQTTAPVSSPSYGAATQPAASTRTAPNCNVQTSGITQGTHRVRVGYAAGVNYAECRDHAMQKAIKELNSEGKRVINIIDGSVTHSVLSGGNIEFSILWEADNNDPLFRASLSKPKPSVSSKNMPVYLENPTPYSGPVQTSGGCYVATAVYGSYDCPQVWTLRRFRDYTLAETWYGRAFIRTYYAISPTLVKWFGHTTWFKRFWKAKLDAFVAKLNAAGVADTSYNDRQW